MNRGSVGDHARVIGAILRKDVAEFTRDRFFVFITILGVAFMVGIFWLMPDTVDDTVNVGVHAPGVAQVSDALGGDTSGLEVIGFDSTAALRDAVETGDRGLIAGLDLPEGFTTPGADGPTAAAQVYVTATTPDAVGTALTSLVDQLGLALSGQQPPFAIEQTVLGVDRVDAPTPPRDLMRPLFAFFALLLETMALATLVASEVRSRTVTAVLGTPASAGDFLAAKAIFGTGLAFIEATALLLAIRAFGGDALLLLTVLLLGAALAAGIGLLAGSTGRDLLAVVMFSFVLLLPLAVPAVAALFPGSASAWVMAIPTYPLVQAIIGVTIDGAGWSQTLPYLGGLLAWCAALLALGTAVLGRKVRTL